MTDHDTGLNLDDLAAQMMSEATEAHLATEDNRDLVHETFGRLVTESIMVGTLRLTTNEQAAILRSYMWGRESQRAGQRTKNLLSALYRGQMSIEGINSHLDLVITAGEGRRTTLRHLDTNDVRRMTDEREANKRKVVASTNTFVVNIGPWLTGLLTDHGSIVAALRAGAVIVAAA